MQEPLGTYGIARNPVVLNDSEIPDGYMSLDQFGEIFHQKLDTNYENLQSNRQQWGSIGFRRYFYVWLNNRFSDFENSVEPKDVVVKGCFGEFSSKIFFLKR